MYCVFSFATFIGLTGPIKFNLNTNILQKIELNTFSKKIKHLSIKINLNQREFAKIVNYSFTSICNWEQGNRIPSEEALKKISEVLDVDYKYLKE